MILQIDEQYAITSDQYSWQIAELKRRRRAGETVLEWKPILWFTSLENACRALVERSLRLSEASTLAQALAEAERTVARLCAALTPEFEIRSTSTFGGIESHATSAQKRAKVCDGGGAPLPLLNPERGSAHLCAPVRADSNRYGGQK